MIEAAESFQTIPATCLVDVNGGLLFGRYVNNSYAGTLPAGKVQSWRTGFGHQVNYEPGILDGLFGRR